MTAYRRNLVAGGTFFFTSESRRPSLAVAHRQYRIVAGGVPVHAASPSIHDRRNRDIAGPPSCVWILPAGDSDFSTRWRLVKTAFSRGLHIGERVSVSRSR
jgi:putative transposase